MAQLMTDEEFSKVVRVAVKEYSGNVEVLESAIGVLAVGRYIGWKPLYLAHHRGTMANYQKILKVRFQDVLEPEGKLANKSIAWAIVKKLSNFWKAVRGEMGDVRSPELI